MSSHFKRTRILILVMSLLFLLVGCANAKHTIQPPPIPPPAQSASYNYYLVSEKPNYTINQASEDNASYKLSFPEISGLKSTQLQDNINQTLYSEALGMVSPDSTPSNPLTVSYVITRQDDHILSVVYTGTLKLDGKPFEMKSGVTLDLKSSNSINTTNIILSDDTSQKDFAKIFSKLSNEQKLDNDKLDEFMSMNLDDQNLYIFFMDSETATKYATLKIPLQEILPNLNTTFGEVPTN